MKLHFIQLIALLSLSLLLVSIAVPPAAAIDEADEDQFDDGEEEVEDIDEGEDDFDDDDDDDDLQGMSINGQTISFGIPEDDDEFHSMHIPKELKCDACKILAKQFTVAFDKANEKRPSLKKKLPESTIIDLLESECDSEFTSVGVKEVSGVKRLSGPGMAIEEATGIMQGGGKWPYRMKSLCLDIVGEVEEQELYKLYLKGQLESHLCLTKYKSCVTVMADGRSRIEL